MNKAIEIVVGIMTAVFNEIVNTLSTEHQAKQDSGRYEPDIQLAFSVACGDTKPFFRVATLTGLDAPQILEGARTFTAMKFYQGKKYTVLDSGKVSLTSEKQEVTGVFNFTGIDVIIDNLGSINALQAEKSIFNQLQSKGFSRVKKVNMLRKFTDASLAQGEILKRTGLKVGTVQSALRYIALEPALSTRGIDSIDCVADKVINELYKSIKSEDLKDKVASLIEDDKGRFTLPIIEVPSETGLLAIIIKASVANPKNKRLAFLADAVPSLCTVDELTKAMK